jgi:hypothetical protein
MTERKGNRTMATITQTTLLDLVQTVNAFAASDAEVVATVAYLINSGKVRLCGNFAGAKIDLAGPTNTSAYRRLHAPASSRKVAYVAAQ